MKHFLLSCCTALLLAGCGQDNPAPRMAGHYTSEASGSTQPVRMYTVQGEVTDAAAISAYLQRKNAPALLFNLTETTFQLPAGYVALDIEKDNSVTVAHAPSVPYKATVISSNATELLIAQQDSVQIFVPAYRTRCDELSLNVRAHMPAGKFLVPPPFSGYNSGYKFRPQFVLQIKDGQLFLPLLTYGISNTTARASCWTSVGNVWDTFNTAMLPQLQPGDTLVYQVREVRMVRR